MVADDFEVMRNFTGISDPAVSCPSTDAAGNAPKMKRLVTLIRMLLFDIPLRVPASIGLIVAPFLETNCSRRQQPAATHVDSSLCRSCHAQIFAQYSHTGMARSFYQPRPENTIEAYGRPFYHRASDTWFRMERRSAGYYQRRWQIGYIGMEENAEDLKIDYVMGSGNHVRTYLHRTSRGTLDRSGLWPGTRRKAATGR